MSPQNMATGSDTIASVEAQLREAGIQPTAQRLAISTYVLSQKDHPSVEEVKRHVDQYFPKISLATVYNTLNLLVEAKLLKPIRLPESDKVHFDCNVAMHAHFLDLDTGELEDLDLSKVKVEAQLGKGYKAEQIEVMIRGRRK